MIKIITKKAIVMVEVWVQINRGLVLGQRKVDSKSNEITAIPGSKSLYLKGLLLSIKYYYKRKLYQLLSRKKLIIQSSRKINVYYMKK